MQLYSTGQLSLVPKVQPRHDLTQEVLGCETFLACALAPTSTKAVGSMRACMLSRFSRVQLFAIRLTVARQAPLSMGFSRQECWSVLSCLLHGIFPTQGLNLSLLCLLPGKSLFNSYCIALAQRP